MVEKSDTATAIMLAIFHLNGALIDKGNRLSEPLGLTSTRWQILGAIALSTERPTAPQIGDMMGMTRQGVQRQINLLVEEKMIEARANPRNMRSPFYILTELGATTYARVMALETIWADALVETIAGEDLQTTLTTLKKLGETLQKTPLPAQ
ncbi:MarR family transcriptional regulator [Martelella alba]|uniref:MarR family transcriptional regulator n=1 Tax=Martelella alba TaxID=2590451 RepID=A0A506UFU8_9HYPH|nr:MarR family winged helix-turn-helix transcriptional regulator [Martelella alba]TPW31779.1 MarR family transcriptional regulator [Martelella alba]